MTEREFFERLSSEEARVDLLGELKKEVLPLVLWGNGSLAYSIYSVLKQNGITIACCMVDGLVEEKEGEDYPIYTREHVMQKYSEFAVIVGHSIYEKKSQIMEECKAVKRCYCLVNVCYRKYMRISYPFVREHAEDYIRTANLLQDEMSRECLMGFLNSKLTEKVDYLLPCVKEKGDYFNNTLYEVTENESYVDVGAYDGDTVKEFLKATNGKYDHIYAIEPETAAFNSMKKYVEEKRLENVTLYSCGTWNEETVLYFSEDAQVSGIVGNSTVSIRVTKLDNLLIDKEVSMVKINFLDGVYETLIGATGLLQKQKPKLMIKVGFDEWTLIRIPELIRQINPEYKLYLRYASAIPARLILFAV